MPLFKEQSGAYSIFSGGQWIGVLTTMSAVEGYKIKMESAMDLTFQGTLGLSYLVG